MRNRNTQHAFASRSVQAFATEVGKLNRTVAASARAQRERHRLQRPIAYRIGR